jgi:hypothetical protein
MLNYDLSNDAIIINNLENKENCSIGRQNYIAKLYYAERKIERILTDWRGRKNINKLDTKIY